MDICSGFFFFFDCRNDAMVSLSVPPHTPGEISRGYSTNPSLSPGFAEGQVTSVVEVE